MQLRLRNAPPVVEPREAAPVRISVAMMVGNEAHFIEGAIRSASWADEVVVLDTGSTDGTGEIASRLGAKVTREERIVDIGDGLRSIDNFGAARTRSIELASGDWVVLLDADERFAECAEFRTALEQMPDCVDFGSMALEHEGRRELDQYMTRVFRRSAEPRYKHRIHETLETWAEGRTHATLPREAGYVRHLGGAVDTRAKLRRDERNWRLIQRALDDDANDPHALSYAIDMLMQQGRHDLAEPMARHAWQVCSAKSPARHRITLALCELHWMRSDLGSVVALLRESGERWGLDPNARAGLGLALWLSGQCDEARAHLLTCLECADMLSPVMLDQVQRALSEIRNAA